MSFKGRDKSKDNGPVLRRDQNNKLDRDDAKQKERELTKKLILESKHFDKDMSFNARGLKRDVVVLMTVCIRNTVDGHISIGDNELNGYHSFGEEDPFKYKTVDMLTVEFKARSLPANKETVGKGLLSGFNLVCKWLMQVGAINNL